MSKRNYFKKDKGIKREFLFVGGIGETPYAYSDDELNSKQKEVNDTEDDKEQDKEPAESQNDVVKNFKPGVFRKDVEVGRKKGKGLLKPILIGGGIFAGLVVLGLVLKNRNKN